MTSVTGYLLAILTGIFFGLQGTYAKKISSGTPAMFLAWITFLFTVPFLFVINIGQPFPEVHWKPFLIVAFTSLCINFVAWTLFFLALQKAPLYLTMPFTAFTPAFLLPIALILFGEWPTATGFLGIGFIIAGAYGLHIESRNFWQPLISLYRVKGTRYMLIVAILWSVTATIEKVAILNSSPAFYGLVINLLMALAYIPVIFTRYREQLPLLFSRFKAFAILGLISAALVLCQFTALKYLYVSYVIAFKRAGVIVSVFLGFFFFQEKHVVKNIFCSALMVAGATLIMIAG